MKFIISVFLFKRNIKRFETFLAIILVFNIISFTIANKNFLTNKNNLKNNQVLIPDSKDPNGGQYVISCQVCQKIIHKYINNCVTQEAEGNQADTLLAYCESLRKPITETTQQDKQMTNKYDLCLMLNDRLSIETGEKSSELVDPTKNPGLCIKFKNECEIQGGAPRCYSGLCSNIVDCIDCPTAFVKIEGKMEEEVCGAAGLCKLGWKNKYKGGNGYCECNEGMRGISCNEIMNQ